MKMKNIASRDTVNPRASTQRKPPWRFYFTVLWIQTVGPWIITVAAQDSCPRASKATLAGAESHRPWHRQYAHDVFARLSLSPCWPDSSPAPFCRLSSLVGPELLFSIPSLFCRRRLVFCTLRLLISVRKRKEIIHVGAAEFPGPIDWCSTKLVLRQHMKFASG